MSRPPKFGIGNKSTTMKRDKVRSSTVLSVGYDISSKDLELEFHGSRLYLYHHVPPAVYEGLVKATSIGTYFNAKIKNKYPFTRIK